jgi:hypothetical protein
VPACPPTVARAFAGTPRRRGRPKGQRPGSSAALVEHLAEQARGTGQQQKVAIAVLRETMPLTKAQEKALANKLRRSRRGPSDTIVAPGGSRVTRTNVRGKK